ncbi:HAD family hydrolase [Candidatus Woesearchaeota archaeon]|nr:HAD family hydrolase [Candidatus Woesearchaeota archaeon]
MSKKIKLIIFDLWGTILETGVIPSPLKQSKKILGQFKMPYPEFVIKFEKAFMTKKFNDIREGLDKIFTEFNVSPDEYNRVDRLIGLWNKAKIQSELYEETKEVLNDLKKDYKIVLLSNLPSIDEDIMERFNFKETFDELFLSYETGCIKCDCDIFNQVLEKMGVSKDETIMIGDSMESDIESAKKVGIRGILVDRRNNRDYKDRVLNLRELRAKIEEVV